jgi:hypothetical protein
LYGVFVALANRDPAALAAAIRGIGGATSGRVLVDKITTYALNTGRAPADLFPAATR